MFWVISVYFNTRNTLPKSGTFLLGHPVYIMTYCSRLQGECACFVCAPACDILYMCVFILCVPYVQSPSMGNKMPVTCCIFIVLAHKLVTLNRCCSPLLGNHLFSVKLTPSPCDQHKMMTCHLGLSAYYLHLMLHNLCLMEVKTVISREGAAFS